MNAFRVNFFPTRALTGGHATRKQRVFGRGSDAHSFTSSLRPTCAGPCPEQGAQATPTPCPLPALTVQWETRVVTTSPARCRLEVRFVLSAMKARKTAGGGRDDRAPGFPSGGQGKPLGVSSRTSALCGQARRQRMQEPRGQRPGGLQNRRGQGD